MFFIFAYTKGNGDTQEKLRTKQQAEANDEGANSRRAVAANRHAATPRLIEPATAAKHAGRA